MNSNGHSMISTSTSPGPGGRSDASPARPAHRTLQSRGGRRLLAPLAGASLALALLAGCGGASEADPAEDPVAEAPAEEDTGAAKETDSDDTSTQDETEDQEGGAEQEGATENQEDGTESDPADDATGDDSAGEGAGTNLFEGSWGFGHDAKTLSAEELGTLLEEKAKEKGPSEMSLDVTCADGIDSAAQDYTADCTAFADEGVEHAWTVTGNPAGSGLEMEVENKG